MGFALSPDEAMALQVRVIAQVVDTAIRRCPSDAPEDVVALALLNAGYTSAEVVLAWKVLAGFFPAVAKGME